jgi:hypothetical protein
MLADGLAIPGGAPSYDYEHWRNKIAHQPHLSLFPFAEAIRTSSAAVKSRLLLQPSGALANLPV